MFCTAGGGSEETQPLSGFQLSWSSESDLLRQLWLLHGAPPLAQDGLEGTLKCYVCDCVLRNTLCFLINPRLNDHDCSGRIFHIFTASLSLVAHGIVPPSLSDCVSEGELSRPVVLQPGGAARSALLQPRPHTPQSQKQLHITAQRCSSTHQVSFCHWDWVCYQ